MLVNAGISGLDQRQTQTQTYTLDIDDASAGTNLATYNVHFFRNVAIGGWAENQNVTITIE